jgi:hypothetical protein
MMLGIRPKGFRQPDNPSRYGGGPAAGPRQLVRPRAKTQPRFGWLRYLRPLTASRAISVCPIHRANAYTSAAVGVSASPRPATTSI